MIVNLIKTDRKGFRVNAPLEEDYRLSLSSKLIINSLQECANFNELRKLFRQYSIALTSWDSLEKKFENIKIDKGQEEVYKNLFDDLIEYKTNCTILSSKRLLVFDNQELLSKLRAVNLSSLKVCDEFSRYFPFDRPYSYENPREPELAHILQTDKGAYYIYCKKSYKPVTITASKSTLEKIENEHGETHHQIDVRIKGRKPYQTFDILFIPNDSKYFYVLLDTRRENCDFKAAWEYLNLSIRKSLNVTFSGGLEVNLFNSISKFFFSKEGYISQFALNYGSDNSPSDHTNKFEEDLRDKAYHIEGRKTVDKELLQFYELGVRWWHTTSEFSELLFKGTKKILNEKYLDHALIKVKDEVQLLRLLDRLATFID